MPKTLIDDCFVPSKPLLTHAEALGVLRERVAAVTGIEAVPTGDATGRILAEAVRTPHPIPAHTNAAVDGYAFAFDGYDDGTGTRFAIAGRAAAGHPFEGEITRGAAIRIFTGAVMPAGADTVVMQEDVEADAGAVLVPPGLKPGANRRLAGEDAEAGAVLVRSGARLRPQDVASAAAAGLARLRCRTPLDAAIFSTGDEVIRPPAALGPGQVYDVNAPMLRGLIESAGCRFHDLGVLSDDRSALEAALAAAAARHHVLITSGGASLGEEDHIVRALEALGRRHLWQIAVKPGRPISFGQIGDCVVLGLPGNPVAVFVCFLLYVRPVLIRLAGGDWPEPVRYPVPAAFSIAKKPGRREFWRATLTQREGRLMVEKYRRDGSGLISSLTAADGLIEVAEDVTEVREGEPVAFIPFAEFGLLRS